MVNERKKLGIIILSLVVIVALSMLFYSMYKEQVDPISGKIAPTASDATVTLAIPNNTAPDFTMEDAQGKEVKLSDLKGKPVVLNIWASSCSYCKSEMPYFEKAFQTFGKDAQFVMLNIVSAEKNTNDGRDFIKDKGYTFPVYFDTADQVMALYKLRGLPATLLIDAEGKLVQQSIGAISESKLTKSIEALLD